MTAIANEEAALVDLLAAIDDRKLGQVMRALEGYGQRPMLEPALAAMRPRLRRLRPERPLTLERLLTVPFELALVADDSPHGSFVVPRPAAPLAGDGSRSSRARDRPGSHARHRRHRRP